MSESRRDRGVLDTSVVIALEELDQFALPVASALSAITLAELAAGPHAATRLAVRAKRQERLQEIEASVEVLSFGPGTARAYGRIWSAVSARGRKPRGGRAVDLLIAATALAEGLPLYTLNPADFGGLEDLVEVLAVSRR